MFSWPTFRHPKRDYLILGHRKRPYIPPLVRIPTSARAAHMYVIGMSGKGKSKLLEYCLYQDIAASRGCGLIDPHSQLADDLLRLLIAQNILADPDIRDKLIYVDPARTDYVIPFNVLVTEANHPYDVAATVLEAFRRAWNEGTKNSLPNPSPSSSSVQPSSISGQGQHTSVSLLLFAHGASSDVTLGIVSAVCSIATLCPVSQRCYVKSAIDSTDQLCAE